MFARAARYLLANSSHAATHTCRPGTHTHICCEANSALYASIVPCRVSRLLCTRTCVPSLVLALRALSRAARSCHSLLERSLWAIHAFAHLASHSTCKHARATLRLCAGACLTSLHARSQRTTNARSLRRSCTTSFAPHDACRKWSLFRSLVTHTASQSAIHTHAYTRVRARHSTSQPSFARTSLNDTRVRFS